MVERDWACIPQDARRDITSAANSDHKVGLEVIEDLVRRFLAEFMNLSERALSASFLG